MIFCVSMNTFLESHTGWIFRSNSNSSSSSSSSNNNILVLIFNFINQSCFSKGKVISSTKVILVRFGVFTVMEVSHSEDGGNMVL
jgi:hypothetical protein